MRKTALLYIALGLATGAQAQNTQYVQQQSAAAYQANRQAYIKAISQAGLRVSDFVLPATLTGDTAQMSTQQLQKAFDERSAAAGQAVSAITRNHTPLNYNADKMAALMDQIKGLKARRAEDARNRLPEDVYKRQVHQLQVRMLNILLSDQEDAATRTLLERLRADPMLIITTDERIFPVENPAPGK